MFKRISLTMFTVLCLVEVICEAQIIRQSNVSVTITKKVYSPTPDGRPDYIDSLVCKQQSKMNVYNNKEGNMILSTDDLNTIQCNSDLNGENVSVSVGGAITYSKNFDSDALILKKGTLLILSWGILNFESPQVTISSWTDSWKEIAFVLAPLAKGQIVNSVPQTPEPKEYFTATVKLIDNN